MSLLFVLNPAPKAQEEMIKLIKAQPGPYIGLEMTVPELAALMDVNIDPQHTGFDAATSCVKACLEGSFLVKGGAYFTVRADLDAFASYLILAGLVDINNEDVFVRLMMIHVADTFAHGPWSLGASGTGYEKPSLAGINRCVADYKLPVEERLAALQHWLETGEHPEKHLAEVEAEAEEIATALESGQTVVTILSGYTIVQSELRGAPSIGYRSNPVVLAWNPAFPIYGEIDGNQVVVGQGLKYSVCQWAEGYIDLNGFLAEIRKEEPGWGGSPTFVSSPQNVASEVPLQRVQELFYQFLHPTAQLASC